MIRQHRQQVDHLLFRRRVAIARVDAEERELNEAEQNLSVIIEGREVIQAVAQQLQQKAHRRISSVVSRCLVAVFDEPYEFEIRFERKRNKTEAVMVFSRDGKEHDDPLSEVGGGVIDVVVLALRLASILMSRPRKRKLLVLDEPFKNVRGRHNRRRMRRLLLGLAEEFGVQFVLNVDVDSYPEFALGKVVELR